MSNQPSWHCVANLGDINPLEYGGAFLMIDRRGIYDPELWIYDEDERKVYMVLLERCYRIRHSASESTEVSDNVYNLQKPAWFGTTEELHSVASFCGKDKTLLIDQLCSGNPNDRAEAYQNLVDYHGRIEFDQYPRSYTVAESKRLIRKLLQQIVQAQKWEDGFTLPKK